MKTLSILLLSMSLAACGAPPTRNSDPAQFVVKAEGRVAPSNILSFSDCVIDGFQVSHGMMANIGIKQTRRSTGYRIETLAGGYIVVTSADIFEDGRVAMYESSAAGLINTKDQIIAFNDCLKKYGI